MGCDGGTIPTRDELVKQKKRPEQKDKDSERLFQWQHCHLTQEPLRRPIVSCQLGKLYNKEAIIERLLDKSSSTEASKNIEHIKSLKDIRELDLTPNPSYNSKNASVGDGYVDKLVSPWICPITGLEMNGRFKFVFDWCSGKVLSERAHKMVRDDDDASKILPENLVVVNPTDEDAVMMLAKMEERNERSKAEKSSKKNAKKRKEDLPSTSTSSSGSAAPPAAKVSKSAAAPAAMEKKAKNGLGKPVPVQQDPSKSEVYKSLFSSHSSAQNKPTGHWVTFDPRYN